MICGISNRNPYKLIYFHHTLLYYFQTILQNIFQKISERTLVFLLLNLDNQSTLKVATIFILGMKLVSFQSVRTSLLLTI